jgi:putative ABC transport system ATP-binding protein
VTPASWEQAGETGTATATTVARFEDVTKVYQMGAAEVRALAGVSVSFEVGGFWAIMGPSGSGKSTMLNLLGCLDRPTSGRYLLEGQDVANLDDNALSEFRLRYLGFVFQSFNLIPQLTVRENIELPLYYLDWDADESAARAEEMADRVGLADRVGHRPAELSGGEQQRVAIARALAADPSILLADEPTGNLDSVTSAQIIGLLSELNAQGKTVIMVTHEAELAKYARHRLHMRDGIIDRIEEAAA